MVLAARETVRSTLATDRRTALLWLLLAGAAIEVTLVAGIVLPLRLDHHPPSLQTNVARAYGADLRGLLVYLLMLAALLVASGIGALAARQPSRAALVVALGATALFAATLVPAHPTYSSDVFHYVATARVDFVHGENPHTTAPQSVAGDPLMALSGWKWLPSPYGPGWSWLSRLPFTASGGAEDATRAVLAFKALAALCLVVATGVVALAAERFRPGSGVAAAVILGWNPLALIHLAADGHNDAVMLALLACGPLALAYRRSGLALALFGCACLIKAAAAIAVVMLAIALLRRRAWRSLAVGLAVPAVLGALLMTPYWTGAETFRAMADEGRYFTNTPASLFQRLLEPSLGGDPARVVVGSIARAALLGVALVVAWRAQPDGLRIVAGIAVVYALAVAVLGTWYQPWYATWPLLFLAPLVATRGRWLGLTLGLTAGGLLAPASVNFVAPIAGLNVRSAPIDMLTVALVLFPLALGALASFGAARHGPLRTGQITS